MAEHSTPDRAAVLAALDQVRDPRSGRGLAAAGLVQALVVGPDEAERGVVAVKPLRGGDGQSDVARDKVIDHVRELLGMTTR